MFYNQKEALEHKLKDIPKWVFEHPFLQKSSDLMKALMTFSIRHPRQNKANVKKTRKL